MTSKTTYKNLNAVPNWKLKEILTSHYITGIDGADYAPVKEELEKIYWQRMNAENERIQKSWEREFKEYFKHQNNIKKKA